jgi:hypothetical protein
VETLMDDRNVLPVRYGTRLPDDAAAAQALEANHDRFVASLEFVRGAVEVAVRALSHDDHRSSSGSGEAGMTGTEYLRVKLREAAVQTDAAKAVHEPLAAAARADTVKPAGLPGELLHAAYLVNRDQIDSFSSLVQEIQEQNPSLILTCTGPWPPYSFVQR